MSPVIGFLFAHRDSATEIVEMIHWCVMANVQMAMNLRCRVDSTSPDPFPVSCTTRTCSGAYMIYTSILFVFSPRACEGVDHHHFYILTLHLGYRCVQLDWSDEETTSLTMTFQKDFAY